MKRNFPEAQEGSFPAALRTLITPPLYLVLTFQRTGRVSATLETTKRHTYFSQITKKFEEVQQFGAQICSAGRLSISQLQLLSLDYPERNQSTNP